MKREPELIERAKRFNMLRRALILFVIASGLARSARLGDEVVRPPRGAVLLGGADRLPPPSVVLCAERRPRKSNKPKRLHDFNRDESEGGDEVIGDLESDSQTVLIYPKAEAEGEGTNTTAAEPEPPKSRMTGAGRKL